MFHNVDRLLLGACETECDLRRLLIGQPLMEARRERGLSQPQVAKALGYTTQQISAWERGLGAPSLRVVRQVAEILGVNPRDIIDAMTHFQERLAAKFRTQALRQLQIGS